MATVGEQGISRQLVERWASFDEGLRIALGLPETSPPLVKRAALQALIEDEWTRSYALAHAIDAPPVSIAVRRFEESLGVDPGLLHRLREEARLGEQAIRSRAVAVALDEAIVEQYLRQRPAVPEKAMMRYYQYHGSSLGRPEQRTVRFIVSASEEEAHKAKLGLERGESWAALADLYSVAQVRNEVGWHLEDVTSSDVRALLSRKASATIFTAPTEVLIGPRAFEGGWIVFEVAGSKPAVRPPFSLVREAIRNRLTDHRRDAVFLAFRSRLRAEYRGRTRCVRDFELAWCRLLHP